ncbi:hypothetical protein ACK8HX_13705 [Oryzobacter sp. R7]|uniref:hypothetical protein n=1 Tax=Oryzobacter faecalis TaxID=3388656 RepID=UPI00398D3961
MAPAPGTTRREALRLVGALLLALVGGVVAALAPEAVTPGSPDSAALVWRIGAVGGVIAALLVAASALAALGGRDGTGPARAAVATGWLTVGVLVLGAVHGVVVGVPAGDAVGVSFIVAIPASGAAVLGLMGRRRSEA